MPKGKYSGFSSADFSVMLYRYAVIAGMLGYSEKALPKITLSDEEKNKYLGKTYSEQRERLLFLRADGVISQKAFDVFFDADEDMLDMLCGIEEKIIERTEKQEDVNNLVLMNEEDISVYEKAAGIILFSKRSDRLSDVEFGNAFELASSKDISVCFDFPFHISYSERLTDILLKLGVPLVRINSRGEFIEFDADEMIKKRAEKSSDNEDTGESGDCIYLVNMNRLPFILRNIDRLYGLDFIKYALTEAPAVMLSGTEREYESYVDYLNNRKLKFTVNAYVRLRNLCDDKYNIVDYRINKIVDDRIVSSTLTADEKISVPEIRLTDIKPDSNFSPDEESLLKKALKEYIRPRGIIAKDTVIELLHDGNSYWYVYKDTGDNKFDFCRIERSGFMEQAFDYNKVFEFVKNESSKKNICKRDGIIDFKIDPDGHSPEFLDYARNVLADQYKRKAKNGSLAKSLSERLKAAADNARKPPEPEDPKPL